MKFKVTKQVCMFGVGSAVYYPGDIVEGPDEWVKTNPFLEPIPEPLATLSNTTRVVMVPSTPTTPTAEPAVVKTEEPKQKEEKKVGPEERHATPHRSGKER